MVKVKTFRKKPLEIQAFQVNALNNETVEQIKKWISNPYDVAIDFCDISGNIVDFPSPYFDEDADHIEIISEDGDLILKLFVGDYVVKGIDGSIYPVKEETFKKTYEEVTSEGNSEFFSKAIVW